MDAELFQVYRPRRVEQSPRVVRVPRRERTVAKYEDTVMTFPEQYGGKLRSIVQVWKRKRKRRLYFRFWNFYSDTEIRANRWLEHGEIMTKITKSPKLQNGIAKFLVPYGSHFCLPLIVLRISSTQPSIDWSHLYSNFYVISAQNTHTSKTLLVNLSKPKKLYSPD